MNRSTFAVGLSVMLGLMLQSSAFAQPPSAEQAEPPVEGPVGTQPEVTPANPQMTALEQRAAAQDARLQTALDRIEGLEQRATEAEATAQAAAEAAEAAAAEEEETESEFTLRPVVSLVNRLEVRRGYGDLGRGAPACAGIDGDCFRFRARLGLVATMPLGGDVTAAARFVPQFAGNWAQDGLSGGLTDNGPRFGLHEGSLKLNFGDSFSLEMGRFGLAYGNEVVVGTVGWHPVARVFDGARAILHPTENLQLDAFFTVTNESGGTDIAAGDSYFYGVYAQLGNMIAEGAGLDLYLLGMQTNADGATDWSQRTHLGARFQHKFGMISLRTEMGLQFGRIGGAADPIVDGGYLDGQAILAGHALAEVGVGLLDGALNLALEGAYASGDDPMTDTNSAYNQMVPTAHAFLGLGDAMGARSNVIQGVLHLAVKPASDLTIKWDGHAFARAESGTYAGFESDLHLIWKPLPGFRFRAMYGVFVANTDAFAGANDDAGTVHFFEIEAAYNFQ